MHVMWVTGNFQSQRVRTETRVERIIMVITISQIVIIIFIVPVIFIVAIVWSIDGLAAAEAVPMFIGQPVHNQPATTIRSRDGRLPAHRNGGASGRRTR